MVETKQATSAITGRTLPPEEWHRLADTPLGATVDALDPEHTRIIVVERDGQIVAQCFAGTFVHVEGLWEAPAVRGSVGVARALLDALVTELEVHGVREVVSQAQTPEAEALLEHAGGRRITGTAWAIPIGKDT